jgi:hypothetical protein
MPCLKTLVDVLEAWQRENLPLLEQSLNGLRQTTPKNDE